jgi:hypothetical protein
MKVISTSNSELALELDSNALLSESFFAKALVSSGCYSGELADSTASDILCGLTNMLWEQDHPEQMAAHEALASA